MKNYESFTKDNEIELHIMNKLNTEEKQYFNKILNRLDNNNQLIKRLKNENNKLYHMVESLSDQIMDYRQTFIQSIKEGGADFFEQLQQRINQFNKTASLISEDEEKFDH